MSTFLLTVFPNGKLLLTTEEYLDATAARAISDLFERWAAMEENKPLLIPDTRVQHAASIEVDLEMGVEG